MSISGICPVCAGSSAVVVAGYTDLATTNPEIASWLVDKTISTRISKGSSRYTDFRCPICGEIIKHKMVRYVTSLGYVPCPRCNDGLSFPEKFMYGLLKYQNINFEMEKIFDWARTKRYDFYLPDYDVIIEMHGAQHFSDCHASFDFFGGRNKVEELANDEEKRQLALDNGFSEPNYVQIDCRKSEFDFIYKNVSENKTLEKLINFNHVDLELIKACCASNMVKIVCSKYDQHNSLTDIAKELKLKEETVHYYLIKGNKLGLTSYVPSSTDRGYSNKRNLHSRTGKLVIHDRHKTCNLSAP